MAMLCGASCGVLLGLYALLYLGERMIVQFAFSADCACSTRLLSHLPPFCQGL